jgi:hypothetical protein
MKATPELLELVAKLRREGRIENETTVQPCELGIPHITEDEFQGAVIAEAKAHGWTIAHFRKAQTAHGWRTPVAVDGKGWPDLFCLRGMRKFACELKVPPNRMSPEQEYWLKIMRAAGIRAYCWYPRDWDEIVRVIR